MKIEIDTEAIYKLKQNQRLLITSKRAGTEMIVDDVFDGHVIGTWVENLGTDRAHSIHCGLHEFNSIFRKKRKQK